jgi:hypothetical protein
MTARIPDGRPGLHDALGVRAADAAAIGRQADPGHAAIAVPNAMTISMRGSASSAARESDKGRATWPSTTRRNVYTSTCDGTLAKWQRTKNWSFGVSTPWSNTA